MHTSSTHLLTTAFGPALRRSATLPPSFLIPSFITQTTSSFSTTPSPQVAHTDGNHARGVSALHRKGPKYIYRLEELVSRIPSAEVPDLTGLSKAKKREKLNAAIAASLPKPVLDPAERSHVEVDANHGLWDFFNEERTSLSTPLELSNHGRAWATSELRSKDWEDLWRLWWVCSKERNKLETFRVEKKRAVKGGQMYGDYEAEGRSEAIDKTMAAVKRVLTERWYAWEEARQVAMDDNEVNLYANSDKGESAYIPNEPELEALPDSYGQAGDQNDPTYPPPPELPTRNREARP